MKKIITSVLLLLLTTIVLATANPTKIGSSQKVVSIKSNKVATEQSGLLVVAAFVLGFYNGYMDTKTDYGTETQLAVNIHHENDFSIFDN